MMMKNRIRFVVCLTFGLLLALSGCSSPNDPPPRVTITITGLNRAILPTDGPTPSIYFSLSVFDPATDITKVPVAQSMTLLGGAVQQGIAVSSGSGTTLTFEMPPFPAGNYVLVLGASPSMTDNVAPLPKGRMYITGSDPSTKTVVALDFSTPVPFGAFATNSSNGFTADEIATTF
jgi:hypothetical protein